MHGPSHVEQTAASRNFPEASSETKKSRDNSLTIKRFSGSATYALMSCRLTKLLWNKKGRTGWLALPYGDGARGSATRLLGRQAEEGKGFKDGDGSRGVEGSQSAPG